MVKSKLQVLEAFWLIRCIFQLALLLFTLYDVGSVRAAFDPRRQMVCNLCIGQKRYRII